VFQHSDPGSQGVEFTPLGGELLAQEDQGEDVAGAEGFAGWAEELAVVEAPAGPSSSSAWMVSEKGTNRQTLRTGYSCLSQCPAAHRGAVHVEFALDAALADEFDEGFEVIDRALVDL
jgi:hypothetical protein